MSSISSTSVEQPVVIVHKGKEHSLSKIDPSKKPPKTEPLVIDTQVLYDHLLNQRGKDTVEFVTKKGQQVSAKVDKKMKKATEKFLAALTNAAKKTAKQKAKV